MFAAHVAVAMAGAQQQERMVTAVDSRDLVGQAKGILIERYKISSMEAFRLLVVASQNTNIKLYDVAEYWFRPAHLPSPSPDDSTDPGRTATPKAERRRVTSRRGRSAGDPLQRLTPAGSQAWSRPARSAARVARPPRSAADERTSRFAGGCQWVVPTLRDLGVSGRWSTGPLPGS
jgi:hypothetical protein